MQQTLIQKSLKSLAVLEWFSTGIVISTAIRLHSVFG